ncbi:MAG: TonB-dependent receptor [Saprospiraceae bacterium]|nr:TonB-dependent receptor [Saprospiraceae bacterium]
MKHILLFILLSSTMYLFGQQRSASQGTITGHLLEETSNTPLEFATISLLSPTDMVVVTGGISDDKGMFEVKASFGTYVVKIEFIGYESMQLDNIVLSAEKPTYDLGNIVVGESAQMLDEIEVVAEKSEMQFDLDKRVFNVGKDLANKGGSAEDILDNIPSITVDVEGNVSLRGSENVRILVDGKPSGLVGVGDTDGLKSLPSGMIEKVEVVTNASARYEASGTSGIINIILKKDQQKGVNGSVDISAGLPENYGAGINMNVRRKDVNFFLNYGIRSRRGPGRSLVTQEFFNPDAKISLSEQIGDRDRGGISNSFRGGMDYYISENDILTGSIIYRVGDDYSDATTLFRDFNNNGNLFEISERVQDEVEDETNLEYELRYERKFKQKGRKFTAFVQYQSSEEVEEADYIDRTFDASFNRLEELPTLQRSRNAESNGTFLMQADYVYPLGKEHKFEVGTRISLREIGNDYYVEEEVDNRWQTLLGLSNNFIYDEDIYAAYAIYGNKIGRWSYQVGLRAEHSEVITTLEQTNEINDRTYTNLFPSGHLNYELDKSNTLQLSYSRRISRPRFWYLNPFFTFSNNRNIWGGNPNLDPEFTDSYELGIIKYIGEASFGSSFYYRHTTGVIERISFIDSTIVVPGGEEGSVVTRTLPQNLSDENSYGFELTGSADINKWWRLDGSLNLFAKRTQGSFEGQNFDAQAFSLQNRLSSKMKFWKDAEFQTRFWYRAPETRTQGRSKSMMSLDLAFSKDVLQKKGTITLSVRDLLNTRKYRYETLVGTRGIDGFFLDREYQRRPRQTNLSFNYRINQKKQRQRGGDRGDDGGGNGGEF